MSQAIHQSFYAVLQKYNIEIYEEAQTFSTEFEVRKQLRLMNSCQPIYRLDFDNHQLLHKEIKTIANIECYLSIDER